MLFASLLFCAAQAASPAGWAVLNYGTDLGERDRWIALGSAYDDLGGWLVLAADKRLPDRAVTLPPLLEGEELVVISDHLHADGKLAPLPGRLLWTAPGGGLRLAAANKTALAAAPIFRCHGAMRSISGSQAIQPVTGGAGVFGRGVITPDPDIQSWVAQLSQANLANDVATLEAFGTRRLYEAGEVAAENWLVSRLQSYGLIVTTFDYDSGADVVIAELPGLADPSRIVVIGAHYDSINYAGSTAAAPGADDDASGTAGVLEIARILSQQQFDYTIRFCAWSGEEFGLLGSEAYAAHLDNIDANVIGMVQLDMTAYRAAGDSLSVDFVLNNTDPGLNAFAMDAYSAYVPTLAINQGFLSGGTSDHRSFFQHGFPATFPFEDLGSSSPYIHGFQDVSGVSANDFQLAELITKGALATIAEVARPASILLAHQPLSDTLDEIGPYPVAMSATPLTAATVSSATLHWRVDGGNWTSVPMMQGFIATAWNSAIPGQPSPAVVDYWLEAEDSNGRSAWLPESIDPGSDSYSFVVGQQVSIYFEDFDGSSDAGWTHAQVATQDDWQRGAPQGKAGDPSSAYSGANNWGNDLGASGWNGEYQPNVDNWLQAPDIDCSNHTDVRLRFQRWLTVEESQYDVARILVNGLEVWRNPVSGNIIDNAWMEQDLDISQWADGHPAVQLRFEMESDGGLEFGGWNLDDVELYTLSASPSTTNTLSLTGPGTGQVGALVPYAIGGMQPNASWWLAGGPSLAGQSFNGHIFDLGNPFIVVAQGSADAAGNASATVSIPPTAAGLTVYLEAASQSGGVWQDSAPLTLVVQ